MMDVTKPITMKDNKLIAEFMGYDISTIASSGVEVVEFESKDTKVENLKYHESWDWLMCVVDKIEDYLSDNVGEVGYFDDGLVSNDIEVRYQAVVEFIKQYNDGKQ